MEGPTQGFKKYVKEDKEIQQKARQEESTGEKEKPKDSIVNRTGILNLEVVRCKRQEDQTREVLEEVLLLGRSKLQFNQLEKIVIEAEGDPNLAIEWIKNPSSEKKFPAELVDKLIKHLNVLHQHYLDSVQVYANHLAEED